ncbi:hypothetical protein AVEN_209973-1 [Araneus ventricosus]|uniref:Uncharacterized protein n=1 Tax=Araneus ventricosus TaxID=182803 RepID=A0A4Y2DD91_ARAVE|nr:hypothetical protein AVEN_209973-1 [Araneus ventricosus]
MNSGEVSTLSTTYHSLDQNYSSHLTVLPENRSGTVKGNFNDLPERCSGRSIMAIIHRGLVMKLNIGEKNSAEEEKMESVAKKTVALVTVTPRLPKTHSCYYDKIFAGESGCSFPSKWPGFFLQHESCRKVTEK